MHGWNGLEVMGRVEEEWGAGGEEVRWKGDGGRTGKSDVGRYHCIILHSPLNSALHCSEQFCTRFQT